MPVAVSNRIRALLVSASIVTAAVPGVAVQPTAADALEIARILAAKYPGQPTMSYIPALTWSGQLRLTALTGEMRWREKALKDIETLTGRREQIFAPPHRLTTFAGALAFLDAWSLAGDRASQDLGTELARFIGPLEPDGDIKFTTGWTDDMFMASAVLSRVGAVAHADALGRLLTHYARRLQRPDGLFIHAADGPHAWGRGNGFALLGLTEALTYWPASWAARPQVLDIYRRHVAALANHQSDDGSWREVVDEPASYRELTVTAMTTAALARGIARGWIDRDTYEPILNRGWQAVAARVNADGSVKDVCASTGAGPTREYYLNRPVVNGADDRGGAMALLAAIEIATLRRR